MGTPNPPRPSVYIELKLDIPPAVEGWDVDDVKRVDVDQANYLMKTYCPRFTILSAGVMGLPIPPEEPL